MKRNSWIFFLSFFIGIIFINLFGKEWITANGILNRYALRSLSYQPVSGEHYFVYILLLRMKTVFFVFLLARALPRQFAAKGCWCLAAFMLGSLITMFVLANGIFGCLIVLAALCPHGIFYFLALYFWERYAEDDAYSVKYSSQENYQVWRKQTWTLYAVLLLLIFLGCLTESYINPYLFQKVICL